MSEIPVFKIALREDLLDTGDLFIPKQGEPKATGYDVRSAQKDRQDIVLEPGQYFKIPLGFRAFCPAGWYYQLHPRSSTFVKKNMHNLIGIVDESWEGETLFAGQYLPNGEEKLVIKFGDAIGQIIPFERKEAKMLSVSNKEIDEEFSIRDDVRKTGGFGSTDGQK